MLEFDKLFGVAGKTALVTGGAKGLGRSCAEALLSGGARVVIASRNGDDCRETAREMAPLGECIGLQGDVGSEDGVAALTEAFGKTSDRLDILVNNAGLTWGEPYETFPWKAWARVMNVNVAGLFELTRVLTPLLVGSGSADDPARVVNLGSVFGTVPLADKAYSYAASKAAVHHLTRILAAELASRHITVNALAPGPFESRMTAFALADPAKRDAIADSIPLGRIGEPPDIAGALLFLCGRAGAYVTGAVLPLDGGMSVQTRDALFHV